MLCHCRLDESAAAYTVELFDAELLFHAAVTVGADANNRWLTESDIRAGRCRDGRAVSATMLRILSLAGLPPTRSTANSSFLQSCRFDAFRPPLSPDRPQDRRRAPAASPGAQQGLRQWPKKSLACCPTVDQARKLLPAILHGDNLSGRSNNSDPKRKPLESSGMSRQVQRVRGDIDDGWLSRSYIHGLANLLLPGEVHEPAWQ